MDITARFKKNSTETNLKGEIAFDIGLFINIYLYFYVEA